MKGRPYSAQVYLIQTDEMQDPEYVIMEMPSILYVLYEMNTIGENHSSKYLNHTFFLPLFISI